jgi:CBS domain containing-hemolysin-like protein
VPETEKINNLLLKFQSEKIYIAIVLDEFGGTAGVVTLEDVLEEVVGDIRDEYDEELPPVKREDDGTYTIIGKTAIRDVNEELKVDLPTEEVSTINGLLLLLFGRVPKPNETIRFKGMEFRVLEIKDNIVTKVQAKVLY